MTYGFMAPFTAKEEQVLIRGKCFLYRQKAPFVPSGVSIHGALEYCEKTDEVRCHECGGWFRMLATHAFRAHALRAADYRRKHGLRRKCALCGPRMCAAVTTGQAAYYERLREACRSPQKRAEFGAKAHAWAVASRVRGQQRQGFLDTPERLNESGHCRAQLTQRLKELQARYDGVPTDDQLIQNGLSPSSICLAFHLPTITEVIKLLELTPSLERIGQGVRGYTREYLIEVLRDFWAKYGTLPSRSHERMGMVPRGGAFVRVFGSMKAAYEAAGLARVSGRSPYTRESLIQQMRDFYRAYGHGPRLSRKHGNGTGGGLPPGFPSHRIWKRFFGSMAAAREAAGIESGQ